VIPVYIVVFDGVLLLDLTGIAEPLRLANDWAAAAGRPLPFELRYVGPEAGARCSLGLLLQDIEPLPEELPAGSWLIVPGASQSRESYAGELARKLVAWLARVGGGAAWRMTVCSGALLAARAGWLDGRACTTHHDLIDRLRQSSPAARVVDNRIYVVDRGVATSAGITAGIDLALWAIGEVLGPEGALAVAREMVVFARRAGADPQLSPWLAHRGHLHPAVHKVQDALAAAPADDWPLPRMAALAHTSERHLSRLFADHAGITPLHYLQQLRLALAEKLLADPRRSVENIAGATGFGSAHHLRRVWQREKGGSPRQRSQ
jgi:transcriptional regulator GlxA family with amidase domain